MWDEGLAIFQAWNISRKKDSKLYLKLTVVQGGKKILTALGDHAQSFIPCSSLKLPILMMEGVDEQPDSRPVPSHCLRV